MSDTTTATDRDDTAVSREVSLDWPRLGKQTLLFLVVGLLFTPLVAGSSYIGSFVLIILVFAVMISGFDVMFGWANLYVFCPATFALIGGVTSALLADTVGAPFLLSMVAGALLAALVGLLIAVAVVVIGTDFDIVIATLAFGEVMILLFNNWEPVGPTGIFSISKPAIASIVLESQTQQYLFLLVVVTLTILAVSVFTSSRLGTLVVAMGENEALLASLGYNPARYKFLTIAFGAFLLGLGGALYAHVNGIITPRDFGVHQTLFFVLILMIGGLRSRYGPLVGAIVMVTLPEIARTFGLGNIRPYIVGTFLIVVVMYMPRGIVGATPGTVNIGSFITKLKIWES